MSSFFEDIQTAFRHTFIGRTKEEKIYNERDWEEIDQAIKDNEASHNGQYNPLDPLMGVVRDSLIPDELKGNNSLIVYVGLGILLLLVLRD